MNCDGWVFRSFDVTYDHLTPASPLMKPQSAHITHHRKTVAPKFADQLALSWGSSIRGTGDDSNVKRVSRPGSREAKTFSAPPAFSILFTSNGDTRGAQEKLQNFFFALFSFFLELELLPKKLCARAKANEKLS